MPFDNDDPMSLDPWGDEEEDPQETDRVRVRTWYVLYIINGEDMDKAELKDFRNRFRLPYENFQELLQEPKCV